MIERNGTPMAVLMGFDVHERPIAACTRDTPDDKSSREKDNGKTHCGKSRTWSSLSRLLAG